MTGLSWPQPYLLQWVEIFFEVGFELLQPRDSRKSVDVFFQKIIWCLLDHHFLKTFNCPLTFFCTEKSSGTVKCLQKIRDVTSTKRLS